MRTNIRFVYLLKTNKVVFRVDGVIVGMAPFLLKALENRSGITDSGVIAREGERISKKKGLGLFWGWYS